MVRIRTSRPRPIGRYVRRGFRGFGTGEGENFTAALYTGPVPTPVASQFQAPRIYEPRGTVQVPTTMLTAAEINAYGLTSTEATAVNNVRAGSLYQLRTTGVPLMSATGAIYPFTEYESDAIQAVRAQVANATPGIVYTPGGGGYTTGGATIPTSVGPVPNNTTPVQVYFPGQLPPPPGGQGTLPGQTPASWIPQAPPKSSSSFIMPALAIGAALLLAKVL